MSFWCGVLFVVTTAFSLNVLYHDLFVTEPGGVVPKGSLIGSLHQAAGNTGATKDPNCLDFLSPPKFKIYHPFTALLPAKQAFDIQFEVDQEDTTEKDEVQPAETGLAVIETGLSVIHSAQSVIENEHFDVEIVELVSDLDEDDQEPASDLQPPGLSKWSENDGGPHDTDIDISRTIIDDDLPRETLLTCPAKDAASFKTKVKEEIPKRVSEVISLGEHKNTSATNETVNLTEKVVHKDQPAEAPIQQLPQGHLERDVIILLAVHLTLVITVLLMGCRCLCAHKYDGHSPVNIEELLVTVGLISCIVVALFALLGATIILFIRILLAKFP
ncbi:uncharacterized protein LOC119977471 isoform X1 [Scyliorhinus canicula]|uniref:uncharacterized protein LOC119977471 isoform X1 n=1 Tax=Scyliorhinus canicula TaxID=7830 RepID=UPI0018F61DE3|nr:uncharacterized protein LOC119977471 isoform X1 [Scyliorhinus canicula]